MNRRTVLATCIAAAWAPTPLAPRPPTAEPPPPATGRLYSTAVYDRPITIGYDWAAVEDVTIVSTTHYDELGNAISVARYTIPAGSYDMLPTWTTPQAPTPG